MKKSLVLIVAALLSPSAEAFQAPNPVVGSSPTKLDAAISPRSTPIGVPTTQELKVKRGEMVLDPYYGIPNGILLGAPAILALYTSYFSPDGSTPPIAIAGAAIHLILGYYVYKQTNRVRCVFDKKTFEFKNIKGNELVTKPNKNYVKGGINKWDCSTVVDFGYFPSKSYPMITWFKETETPHDQWGLYGLWGKVWTNPSVKSPAIHFFPGFIDIDTWEKEILKRGATKRG